MRHLRLVGTIPRSVRRRLTVQAVEHHDAELVHDSLRDVQPMQLGMEAAGVAIRLGRICAYR